MGFFKVAKLIFLFIVTVKCAPIAERTDFELYGSTHPEDKAILLIPNQAQERIKVPMFPGLDILSKYTHLSKERSGRLFWGILHTVKMP